MNKLHYSPEALRDLNEIWEYIFGELENPTAAENTVNTILEAIDKLQDFSGVGSLLSSVVELESDYRFLVCGNYLAFYRVVGSNVYIDRVLYGRRDYLRILFDKSME
ncbi:type II toxin-antitoxin system RelE/ParE family toxin [Desulforamulus aeronauticus]|uniref:Addiction module toxin, RelE/StbE family n=1 Tax=Desulforamulus aeronauticus DSM 10349 TaxID=1121421 RepID=A0A1M6S407_9FIRM|nr:type II toxin-antitoxin system RelE/ParE family toxin [Desulforamulus aeronauticus]SHK39445.1 addiction module toxin, RelE/StbE family [Desulforamulus aeronauticus DSM 10349]